MQRSSRQVCLGHICEERWPPCCPFCLWYVLARGLPFAFHCRVMNTSTVRYLSYATAHNSRQISGIFAKSRAIWNRIDVCIKWHTSCHFSYIVWGGWYPELIKSVKFSFTAWQYIAGCSYMAQLYGGRMHTTAAVSLTWLHRKQLCASSTYRQDAAIFPPSNSNLVVPIIVVPDYGSPPFQECSSKTPPGR